MTALFVGSGSWTLCNLSNMIEKLEQIKHRFEEVSQLIVQPDAMSDMKKYGQLNKEYKDLEKVVKKYDEYQLVRENIKNTKQIIDKEKDQEFRDMAKMELDELLIYYPKKQYLPLPIYT